jgi:hypothetical protein
MRENRMSGDVLTTYASLTRWISSCSSSAVTCTTGMRRCASSLMNSARLVPAISAAFDCESSPCEYQSKAAATASLSRTRSATSAAPRVPLPAGRTLSWALSWILRDQDTPSAAGRKRLGLYARTGAEAPVRFYRLSADCQPKLEKLVAGARNPLNLEFAWAAA